MSTSNGVINISIQHAVIEENKLPFKLKVETTFKLSLLTVLHAQVASVSASLPTTSTLDFLVLILPLVNVRPHFVSVESIVMTAVLRLPMSSQTSEMSSAYIRIHMSCSWVGLRVFVVWYDLLVVGNELCICADTNRRLPACKREETCQGISAECHMCPRHHLMLLPGSVKPLLPDSRPRSELQLAAHQPATKGKSCSKETTSQAAFCA